MKHPALARVFAVVLAILSLLLLTSGLRGFQKTEDEHAERLAYEKKFKGRIENYQTLRDELENSADYQETMDALKLFLEEHEKAAAKHKTDTAIYSATKGGLKMGEDMIVSVRAQMNEIREQLKSANSRHEFLEGLLTELIASQKSKMPWLEALANQAAMYAGESYMQSAGISLVTGELRALLENEPTPESVSAAPYNPPEPPVEMWLPELPDMGGMSFAPIQPLFQPSPDAILDAASAYEQAATAYAEQLQDYYDTQARQTMERLNGNPLSSAAVSAEYTLAHALWEDECKTVKSQLDLSGSKADISRLSQLLSSLVRQADNLSGSLTKETGGIYPALEELTALVSSLSVRLERVGRDLSAMSNADFLDLADDVQEIFDLLTDAFIVIAQNLDNPASLIAELMDKLHITEVLAKLLEGMLEKAEQQMQASLEDLWYQMGEAEKDAIKLEAEKLGLDKEAQLLSRRTLDADALKDLRNRHASARQLLLNVPEIKARAADDSMLADSAWAWLDTYRQETEKLHLMKRIINGLAVFGGAMGVLGIPAAYELVRKRFLLIAPVVLCLVCAAGAECLHVLNGYGQQYVALFTAIFALLQLLIVLPKARKARHVPRHLSKS